ncbi:SAS049 family protein [Staphylococcus aureus]
MSFMDKAKDAVEKFKNSDNEQVKNVKDKINEYTGSNNKKEEKKENEDKEK